MGVSNEATTHCLQNECISSMYQCGSVYVCVDEHVCVCVCVCVCMHATVYLPTRTSVDERVRACDCLCVCVCVYMCVLNVICSLHVHLSSGQFSGRPADYLFMLIFCGVIIIVSLTIKTIAT